MRAGSNGLKMAGLCDRRIEEDKTLQNRFMKYIVYLRLKRHNHENKSYKIKGRVDSTEFAKLTESAENHNFLSSLIKQPKNYP